MSFHTKPVLNWFSWSHIQKWTENIEKVYKQILNKKGVQNSWVKGREFSWEWLERRDVSRNRWKFSLRKKEAWSWRSTSSLKLSLSHLEIYLKI